MPPENDFDPNDKSKLSNSNKSNSQCPIVRESSTKINENDINSFKKQTIKASDENPKSIIVWRNVLIFVFLHIGALCGVICCFFAMKATLIFCEFHFF